MISNQTHGLSLISNTFEENSGLRGIIMSSLAASYKKGFILFNNTFHRNSAIYSAAVLNLKILTNANEPLSCSGFHIESNTFSKNLMSQN